MATVVRIATTTSVDQSGLASVLKTAFETYQSNYTLQWNPLGSGGAMDAARAGNADMVCSHDRIGEFIFLAERYALVRQWVFYNYFVLVGPASGGTINGTTLQTAFQQIYSNLNTITFVSRGNAGLSGTYVRERQIWKRLGITPPASVPSPGPGIVDSTPDPSMMGTIQSTYNLIRAGVKAYTMTDIGTWYAFLAGNSGASNYMTMLTSPNDQTTDNPPRDPWASNQYVLMPVIPDYGCFGGQTPNINTAGAQAFLDWMLSPSGKAAVNGFLISPPIPGNQGFIYNADVDEHFPDDKCLIRPITEHGGVAA